jgi:hypothetical protein
MRKLRLHIIFFLLFLCNFSVYAQEIQLEGYILDAENGEALAFANVFVKGTQIGASSNENGFYQISVPATSDSLVASYLGYTNASAPINKKLAKQTINFKLKADASILGETVIWSTSEPFEDVLFRKIQENKPYNNKSKLSSYAYEAYNKLEIDIKNIGERIEESKILKPFSFVFDYTDSTAEDGTYLPIFMSETLSDFYFTTSTNKKKEVVKATRVAGSQEASLSQFLGSMYLDVNVYDNSFWLMAKEFISPIARAGKAFYNYKVTDTLFMDGITHYKFNFEPKSKADNTLIGYMIVSEDNYALKEIRFKMAPHVNINFVKRIEFKQEFAKVSKMWMTTLEDVLVELSPMNKAPGIIARKTTSYKDIRIEDPLIEEEAARFKLEVTAPEEAAISDDSIWQSLRHIPLSKSQENVYQMVDTIQKLPAYQTYVRILQIVLTGSVPVGPISIGEVSKLFSKNIIEGWRFRIGFTTNSKFSETVKFGAHIAYGTLDKSWKYGGDIKWLFDTEKRKIIGGSYNNDIDFSGNSNEIFVNDNIFGNLYRRKVPIKLTRNQVAKVFYQQDWAQGYSIKTTFQHSRIQPLTLPYQYLKPKTFNGIISDDTSRILQQAEIVVKIRLAPGEKYLYPKSLYRQYVLGTKPVFQIEYTYGFKAILGSQYTYHKFIAAIDDRVNLRPIGYFKYHIEVGKTFGTVPYLLMQVHPGNETVFLNTGAYDMMNQYEFYSQQYLAFGYTHHFDGVLFNRIPGIRKLKLREVAHFKAVWGTVNNQNQINNRENPIRPFGNIPYMEAGVGIENILKVFRVEAVWRLSYRDLPNIPKFGVRVGFDFDL